MVHPRTISLSCMALALSVMPSLLGQRASASSARTRAEGPSVVIGSTKRDFGDVFAGEELEQNFPVRNAGTRPLELSQKSTLSLRSITPDYTVSKAVWRPNEPRLIRTVAAKPAAPS